MKLKFSEIILRKINMGDIVATESELVYRELTTGFVIKRIRFYLPLLNLETGIYKITATSIAADGTESDHSNAVEYTVN